MNEFDLKEGRLSELDQTKKNAILIGTYSSAKEKFSCQQSLLELESLAKTYGLETIRSIPVPLHQIDSSLFIGKGKTEEILQEIPSLPDLAVIIFDEELSPHQQRNLEKIFSLPVIDRTELILGVFAKGAKTKEAKIQIQLAQHKYQFPRLKRMWTHLSRQRTGGSGGSGGGFLKGEGERQLEIDKRILRSKMHHLQRELKEIVKHREVQRKARMRNPIPIFAIIGYTNAGKSTLFNALTKAGVFVEDKLFVTLDPKIKKFRLPNHQEILLIDTVGFIKKIPHTLVAAFKSTLEEALHADFLIHLIDVSNPNAEEQAEATFQVLKELHAEDRPTITCLNKIDACTDPGIIFNLKLKYQKAIEISALKQEGFDALLSAILEKISSQRKVFSLKIPQSKYAFVSQLLKEGKALSVDYQEDDIILLIELPSHLEKTVEPFLIKN